MNFIFHSHRNALTLFRNDPMYTGLYNEVCESISSITDEDIISAYNSINRAGKKSISQPINRLIKDRLMSFGWIPESPIFEDNWYSDKRWRLDFAKGEISVEVAFNHGEATSWNLFKPVMASELNHVRKAIQTSAGIIICATESLKSAGNFDNAVGTYEKFLRYLTPMYNILTTPLLLIGLAAPQSFKIDHETREVIYNTHINHP